MALQFGSDVMTREERCGGVVVGWVSGSVRVGRGGEGTEAGRTAGYEGWARGKGRDIMLWD